VSARRVDILDIVSRYAAGYFPLYDEEGNFYWERQAVRAVIPVNEATVARARRLARRARKRFEIRYTTSIEEVIRQLQREEIKKQSWVKEEVVAIYRTLHKNGMLRTVEAWNPATGELQGALLGLVLPGTYIAETMYGTVPEASKICLCQLVEDCLQAGFEMIDVQTPHDFHFEVLRGLGLDMGTAHPCVRLGEEVIPISRFRRHFEEAWRRAFKGGAEEWIATCRKTVPAA
jgi:leucyl/phenylalanyl-tRNA--protein transferase